MTWSPRWAWPDVATAPRAYRDDGEHPGRVERVLDADAPGRRSGVGDVADHVAAGRQADVGVGQRAAAGRRRAAPPSPSPRRWGRGRVRRRARAGVRRRHRRTPPGPARRGRAPRRPRAGSPSRSSSPRPSRETNGVVAVGAEHPVDLVQARRARSQARAGRVVVGVAAAQGQADRHPHHVLDVPALRRGRVTVTGWPGRGRSAATGGSPSLVYGRAADHVDLRALRLRWSPGSGSAARSGRSRRRGSCRSGTAGP